MRNCFANVAISSSVKRLRPRPSIIHKAPFGSGSGSGSLRISENSSCATARDEQDGPQEWIKTGHQTVWNKGNAEETKQVADSVATTSRQPPEATRHAEASMHKHHEMNDELNPMLASMTPQEPYVEDLVARHNARTRRATFLFAKNYEVMSSLASLHPDHVHGDVLMLSLPQVPRTGGYQSINLRWTRNFATVYAKRRLPHIDLEPVLLAIVRKRFVELVRKLRPQWDLRPGRSHLRTANDMEAHATASLAGQQWPIQLVWSDMMLMVMRYMPNMTAQILQASFPSSRPPFYIVAQTLDFIATYCVKVPSQTSHQTNPPPLLSPEGMVDLILDLVSQCSSGRTSVLHDTVAILLKQLDLQHGYVFFNGLRAFNSHISLRSCLTFAEFFVNHGEYETALEACEMFIDMGGSSEDYSLRVIAPKLLRRSILIPNAYHDSGYIIGRFLDMGLRIGLSIQTTLIANAFDSKDIPTAMNITDLMKEHGHDLDAHAYAIMLKGLRDSKDKETIDDMLGMAWAEVEASGDSFLAGEVLYWYYAQHVRKADATWAVEQKARFQGEALHQLVSLYTRVFDSTPLDVLGFANLVSPDAWSSPSLTPALRPPPFVMNLMILAYTRARVLTTGASSDEQDEDLGTYGTIFRLYERWWLIATRAPLFPNVPKWITELFATMMRDPHTLTIFMHALGAQSNTLYHAVKILQRMESREFKHCDAEGRYYTTNIAKPDLIAWSVLLNAFAGHGQVEATEKCFTTMRKKGICPDATAWNTLVKGYAVANDVDGVVRALQRKGEAGHSSQDDGILRTLTRVKKQAELKWLLQKEVNERELPDEAVLGQSQEARRADSKPTWAPQLDEHVIYQPGAGKRSVLYFDANRTTGLHKEGYTVTEQEASVDSETAPGSRILVGQGSFSLKSDDEEDWFEDDEEDKGDESWWGPMMQDSRSGEDLPDRK